MRRTKVISLALSLLALPISGTLTAAPVQQQDEAAASLKQACDGGDAEACNNLGVLYEHGEGVPQDATRAAAFYERACYGGAAGGCANLGVLYYNGEGVPQDATRAVSLYEQACEGGFAEGCRGLSDPDDLPPPPSDASWLGERPVFTPYTVRPEIKNRREAVRIVERYYPKLMRDAGIGGEVVVWVFIDTNGRVQNALVQESSGHEELDAAAVAAAREFEFTPALNRDDVVPVWVAIPITFDIIRPGKP